MNRSRFDLRLAASLGAAIVPLVFLAGCGSGGGTQGLVPVSTTGGSTGIVATPTPSPSGETTATTRYYAATFPLTTGTATVNLTALADGTASGTLTIDNGRAVKTRVVIGTGNVTGTVNFSTGVVRVNGSITQDGVTTPISVTGTAPTVSGTGGNASLTLASTVYTAQWVVSTTGPIASNSNNGGNASGGASSITFSSNTSNMTTGSLNGAAAVATLQTLPFVGDTLTVTAADLVNGTPRSVTLVLFGQTAQAGASYTLEDGGTTSVIYSEGNGGVKTFGSVSGTAAITSVSGKVYTIKLTGVHVKALTTAPIYQGTGEFTIDGTITATLP